LSIFLLPAQVDDLVLLLGAQLDQFRRRQGDPFVE
jgi:hypothetical protein